MFRLLSRERLTLFSRSETEVKDYTVVATAPTVAVPGPVVTVDPAALADEVTMIVAVIKPAIITVMEPTIVAIDKPAIIMIAEITATIVPEAKVAAIVVIVPTVVIPVMVAISPAPIIAIIGLSRSQSGATRHQCRSHQQHSQAIHNSSFEPGSVTDLSHLRPAQV